MTEREEGEVVITERPVDSGFTTETAEVDAEEDT
jgi:menaquinone-dependent protoporphyrinogen IX oxidase